MSKDKSNRELLRLIFSLLPFTELSHASIGYFFADKSVKFVQGKKFDLLTEDFMILEASYDLMIFENKVIDNVRVFVKDLKEELALQSLTVNTLVSLKFIMKHVENGADRILDYTELFELEAATMERRY